MPMRRRIALMSVAGSARSTPSTVTVPLVGVSSRLQQRSSVLLPEPEGPMMKTVSLRLNRKVDPFQDLVGAETLAQTSDVQDRRPQRFICPRDQRIWLRAAWRRSPQGPARHAPAKA